MKKAYLMIDEIYRDKDFNEVHADEFLDMKAGTYIKFVDEEKFNEYNNRLYISDTDKKNELIKQISEDLFRKRRENNTLGSLKKELKSYRKYIDKYNSAYEIHGKNMTPPGTLADGDKVLIIRELISKK